jgi:hypothetical protein
MWDSLTRNVTIIWIDCMTTTLIAYLFIIYKSNVNPDFCSS